jgi:hypothetical protein
MPNPSKSELSSGPRPESQSIPTMILRALTIASSENVVENPQQGQSGSSDPQMPRRNLASTISEALRALTTASRENVGENPQQGQPGSSDPQMPRRNLASIIREALVILSDDSSEVEDNDDDEPSGE